MLAITPGVRDPQGCLLLVSVLGILSGCRSSRDLGAFAKRHRKALNDALGLNFTGWPSDATYLVSQMFICSDSAACDPHDKTLN